MDENETSQTVTASLEESAGVDASATVSADEGPVGTGAGDGSDTGDEGSSGASAGELSDSELDALEAELSAMESELDALALPDSDFGDIEALLD